MMVLKNCAHCEYNEHGQFWPWMRYGTYLGLDIGGGFEPGPPMLYCTYDNGERTIWVAGNPVYHGEFEKQLNGFPDWCPLMNDPVVKFLNSN